MAWQGWVGAYLTCNCAGAWRLPLTLLPCTVTNLHHLTPHSPLLPLAPSRPGGVSKAYARYLLTQQWWSVAGEFVHWKAAMTGTLAVQELWSLPSAMR